MKLSNRLVYYFVGFSIGILFVILIWNKKGTTFPYGPNARVLKDINGKNVHYSNELHSAFSKNKITASIVLNIIKDGDVNFSKSNTKLDSCKTYVIEKEINKINYSVELENCKNEVKVLTYELE